MKSYGVTIQMKATEQYFPVVLFIIVREFYQPYPSQFCDVEQHYQIRARATK